MLLRESALQNGAIAPPMTPKACSTPSRVSASTSASATVPSATACSDVEIVFGTTMLGRVCGPSESLPFAASETAGSRVRRVAVDMILRSSCIGAHCCRLIHTYLLCRPRAMSFFHEQPRDAASEREKRMTNSDARKFLRSAQLAHTWRVLRRRAAQLAPARIAVCRTKILLE